MNDLATALEASARLVNEALVRAREELAALNKRKEELEMLIAQAEAMQHPSAPAPSNPRGFTLHEAIAAILREEGNRWMSAREIADAVNSRGLYHKKDGSLVETSQIHARTKNYGQIFEKSDAGIRLHPSAEESR